MQKKCNVLALVELKAVWMFTGGLPPRIGLEMQPIITEINKDTVSFVPKDGHKMTEWEEEKKSCQCNHVCNIYLLVHAHDGCES